ncbi:MAG: Peptidase, M50 family [Candidatus Moranbacteria bacterium GW2011_GWE2_35_2-]|nr:MAG: Peptidase, M50 family [Candidatus Moranbacteria bacterium GW2011_GWE2_35_2-]KKQ06009.1 MAG: Peptidase, M50 family [Candidatus Moranbacteria bacterium GW2011_GWF1_36_4]KKQ22803.1 MAG: Peptidase, M50 family [Candidatus Moranbacteria bacterium GW2011_GWF2_37_11]KKQ28814.1 MAG: Peptidase, M50 family [Candidatus Moranbacteria bacterium GW2011_GWD1_37_17]KKQ30966.1 MAG: Peptidase, M50 family [Candidatus Moranbacteria bacterium GW2011_GWE1_37_24]KKQ47682.1 MAG: Peptidase, M50 family [Candidat
MSGEIVLIVFQVSIVIMSVVIHEVSHGMAALYLGDSTAKYAGRLTLNPLRHLDFWGSFLVPLFMIFTFGFGFGWAKPVPYNPYNLKDQKKGPALVGLAGPLSNIVVALIFGLGARFIAINHLGKIDIINGLLRGDYSNLVFAVSGSLSSIFFLLFTMIVVINVFLAFFNLIPIPPLDGSKILFYLVPIKTETKIMLESFGFILLLMFIFLASPLLGRFLYGMLEIFFRYVVGI